MSVKDEITSGIRSAMRAANKERLSVLRMLLSEFNVAEASGKEFDELAVVRSYAKKLQKTADQYRELNLPEHARKAEVELTIVEEFLPVQMGPSEIEELVCRIVDENDYGPRDLGRVMKTLMSAHGDRVDGRLAQDIARRKLAERG